MVLLFVLVRVRVRVPLGVRDLVLEDVGEGTRVLLPVVDGSTLCEGVAVEAAVPVPVPVLEALDEPEMVGVPVCDPDVDGVPV